MKRFKNPTDQKFLDQLTIERSLINYEGSSGAPPGLAINYTVKYKTQIIAHAYYRIPQSTDYFGGHYVVEIDIYEDEDRRKGIATWLYNYIEKDLNIKLEPSKWGRTPAGIMFWNNRSKIKKNPTAEFRTNRIRNMKSKPDKLSKSKILKSKRSKVSKSKISTSKVSTSGKTKNPDFRKPSGTEEPKNPWFELGTLLGLIFYLNLSLDTSSRYVKSKTKDSKLRATDIRNMIQKNYHYFNNTYIPYDDLIFNEFIEGWQKGLVEAIEYLNILNTKQVEKYIKELKLSNNILIRGFLHPYVRFIN